MAKGSARSPSGLRSSEPGAGKDACSLFSQDQAAQLRSRWEEIQVTFVDEPRKAVELADALVAQAIKRLGDGFAEERCQLEAQWLHGDDVSTEQLRMALRRYRSFLDRLLSI